MANEERLQRNARGIPTAETAALRPGPPRGEETVSEPLHRNVVQMEVLCTNGEITSGLSNHARVEIRSPNQYMHFGLQNNANFAGEIGCEARNRAMMAVENPPDWISFKSRNQDCIEVDAPAPLMAGLSSTIRAMAPAMPNDAMVQAGSPGHCVPFRLHDQMGIDTPNQRITLPTHVSTPSPVRDLTRRFQRMVFPSGIPLSPVRSTPPRPLNDCVTAKALRDTASPQMLALERLEFRKIFMIFAYLSGNKIENVLSEDYIRSLECLSIAHFESQIWEKFGCKYIMPSDRAKNLDSSSATPKMYHCNVEIRGDSTVNIFKGPYVENTTTHLQKSIGDDNVLVVKFLDKDSDTDFNTYCQHYHKVVEDGIVLGLRRYRFFIYKDGGKEEKRKEERRKEKNKKNTSPVRCYFILTESGWKTNKPYVLSGRTINEARKLFMHTHTAPTLAKYMTRFALILSRTITLDDLSTVNVIKIDDEPCRDEHGKIVLNRDGEPLIHTDGTGLISPDLALECPTNIFKGNYLKSHDGVACDETPMRSAGSKRHWSLTSIPTEHPLLIQFRMFYDGYAVKGTALVDKSLPDRTIHIRPSMIKIKGDPKLSGIESFNSLEIVSTSNRPKRALTSRFLIALLHYGGVKAEYFMELLRSAIEGADNARCDYEDALKLALGYADMDSIPAQMILSAIPLEEAYLQSRLAFMARQERKGLKQGRLPIDDCFYLMGTTDPTGTLLPNEVCVILDNGQVSGKVLVYKHPGLHFGDIHVLNAKYIKGLEEEYVGNSKYAILFPISGKRSLADEMANSDFDGDMYWVSRNSKLLEQFKPCKPWVQMITPKKTQQKSPQEFDEPQLERQLFHEFMKTRFTPSFACGTAANCWLTYMDRLLTDEVDESEKELIKDKMIKLVDIYYSALDAPKTGNQINIESNLMIKQYPHFMDRKAYSSYHSASILGRIYDEAERPILLQSENVEPIVMSLLPCFTEGEVSQECNDVWKCRYKEYLRDSRLLTDIQDKDERNMKFIELYQKYKHMLYGAAEFEQTTRNAQDVFTEACAIYRIVYERAMRTNDIGKCGFAWKVAGDALCHLHALKSEGGTAICFIRVLRKILRKDRK